VAVHPDAVITGPGVIGDNCRIEASARIGPYSVLGANVRVRSDADIERSVIAENAYIAEQVNIRGAVVGRACDLRAGVKVDEGAVIGGCEDLPVQDDRVRCGGEFFDRLGVEGLAEPLQSRGCLRPRQRRYHP
jgi:NDP-sugar pyrophosphorylase family protein